MNDEVTDLRIERRMRRFQQPDGNCAHCECPVEQYYPVGPIVVTTSAPDDGEIRTAEFCNWECFAHWAAERGGGTFSK